jgi:hypothetical protein
MQQIVDTLHLTLALLPLAVYLLMIGGLNLASRPVVISGAKDMLALGVGISGLVLAGPMELFLPSATAFRFGWYVWPLLAAFYGTSWLLVVLLQRPRIVIYNAGPDQIRSLLGNIAGELDREARWAGECLSLPTLGVQLHLESVALVRNVQLVSVGGMQSFEGWARLERTLRTALREHGARSRNPYGLSLIAIGAMLITAVALCAVSDPKAVAQLMQMLQVGP